MANSNLTINIAAVDKASKTIGQIGKAFGSMKASTLITGTALTAFGAKSIQAFTESEAAQTKLNDAFSRFPKLSDTNVSALNRLNTEMQKKTKFDDEAYGSAEASLAQYNLTGQQIKDLIPLVADFAAKTGQDLPDAAGSVGKALLGQGRALKQVGIDFKDTGSVAGNFTQIMGGLRTQVGGFAEKEGQTAAGKVAILKNEFNDLQEKVGSILVPALGQLVAVLTPLVDGFNVLPGPIQTGVIALTGIAAAAILIGPRLIAAGTAVKAFAAEFVLTMKLTQQAGIGMTAFTGAAIASVAPVVGLTALVGVLSVTLSNQSRILQESEDYWKRFTGAIKPKEFADAAKEMTSAQQATKDWMQTTSFGKSVLSGWNYLVSESTSYWTGHNSVVDQGTEDTARFQETQANLNNVIKATSLRLGISTSKVKEYADKYGIDLTRGVSNATSTLRSQIQSDRDADKAKADATRSTGKLAQSQQTLADKFSTATDKANALRDAIRNLDGGQISLAESEDRLNDSVLKANKSIDENGRTLDKNTEAGRNNRQALRDIAKAGIDYAQSQVDAAKSTEDGQRRASAALTEARKDFIATAIKTGATRKEAERLATQYGLIPKKVATVITARFEIKIPKSAQKALDQIDAISEGKVGIANAIFLALGGGTAGVVKKPAGKGRKKRVKGRASGGSVSAGETYIVGENQPELFVPNTSGTILPNVNGGGFGSASPSVVITGGTFIGSTKADAARWLSDIIREGKARGLVMS